MNTKLDASVIIALMFGCLALSANANVKYTPEYTTNWCHVAAFTATATEGAHVDGDDAAEALKGSWLTVPAGVSLEGSSLIIDTDTETPLVYTNSNVGGVYRITATLTASLSSELPDLDGAKTAICVCTNDTGTATNWYAYINSAWKNLGGTPEIDAVYDIALDVDTIDEKIRYLAKKHSESEYATLTAGINGWVSNGESGVAITKVSFAGSTTLKGLLGMNCEQGYEYAGTMYNTPADAATAAVAGGGNTEMTIPAPASAPVAEMKISASWINSNVDGADRAAKVAALDDPGENGMKVWQSYVLGLDPSDSASKPVVQPVQDSEAGKVSFSIGNIDLQEDSGVPVKYCVKAYSDSSCTSELDAPGAGSAFTNAGDTVTANLPDSGVRYYKMEIRFGE